MQVLTPWVWVVPKTSHSSSFQTFTSHNQQKENFLRRQAGHPPVHSAGFCIAPSGWAQLTVGSAGLRSKMAAQLLQLTRAIGHNAKREAASSPPHPSENLSKHPNSTPWSFCHPPSSQEQAPSSASPSASELACHSHVYTVHKNNTAAKHGKPRWS